MKRYYAHPDELEEEIDDEGYLIKYEDHLKAMEDQREQCASAYDGYCSAVNPSDWDDVDAKYFILNATIEDKDND